MVAAIPTGQKNHRSTVVHGPINEPTLTIEITLTLAPIDAFATEGALQAKLDRRKLFVADRVGRSLPCCGSPVFIFQSSVAPRTAFIAPGGPIAFILIFTPALLPDIDEEATRGRWRFTWIAVEGSAGCGSWLLGSGLSGTIQFNHEWTRTNTNGKRIKRMKRASHPTVRSRTGASNPELSQHSRLFVSIRGSFCWIRASPYSSVVDRVVGA